MWFSELRKCTGDVKIALTLSPFLEIVTGTKFLPAPVASTWAVKKVEPSAPPLKLIPVTEKEPSPLACTGVELSITCAMLTFPQAFPPLG